MGSDNSFFLIILQTNSQFQFTSSENKKPNQIWLSHCDRENIKNSCNDIIMQWTYF